MSIYEISLNDVVELELCRITFSIETKFGSDGDFNENFTEYNIKAYYITDFEESSKQLIANAILTTIDFKDYNAYQLLDTTSEIYDYSVILDEDTNMISEELFKYDGIYNLSSFSILNRFEIVKKYRGRGWGKFIFNALYRAFNFNKSCDLLCIAPMPLQYVGNKAKSREKKTFNTDIKKLIKVYENYGFEVINEHKNNEPREGIIMAKCSDYNQEDI